MTFFDAYFYSNAAVMIIAAGLAMTQKNAVHALLYFIVSVLALGITFYLLNAPLAAALEVMVYAGAIMVLFVFVVMLLNIFKAPTNKHNNNPLKIYALPILLTILLLIEFWGVISTSENVLINENNQSIKDVAKSLFSDYNVFVELGSFILLAGLVGAYHLGKKLSGEYEE